MLLCLEQDPAVSDTMASGDVADLVGSGKTSTSSSAFFAVWSLLGSTLSLQPSTGLTSGSGVEVCLSLASGVPCLSGVAA